MTKYDLRARCSRYFTFADFIECGATWERSNLAGAPIANLPTRDATYEGIAKLAEEILDPLRERFGEVELTYGFAGPTLTRRIKRGIAPALDQHAGSEVTADGVFLCERRGQACDLRVPGVSAFAVGRWIRDNLPFDRLYLYGASRSVHVSYGPDHARKVIAMVKNLRRVVPRVVTDDDWDRLGDVFRAR